MICPKCGYARKLKETVPSDQCPSCGVYYAKVGSGTISSGPVRIPASQAGGAGKWVKYAVSAAVLAGVVAISPLPQWLRGATVQRAAAGKALPTRLRDADLSRASIVMYSLSDCGYCAELRQKFDDARVPYKEYFLDTDPQRMEELTRKLQAAGIAGGAIGTPTLEVNGTMLPNNPPVEEIIRAALS